MSSRGRSSSRSAVRRAIQLSASKYCPVNAMVSAGRDRGPSPVPDALHRCGAPRSRGRGDGHGPGAADRRHRLASAGLTALNRNRTPTSLLELLWYAAAHAVRDPFRSRRRAPARRPDRPTRPPVRRRGFRGPSDCRVRREHPWLVAAVLLSIGVSAAFGLRYSIYGVDLAADRPDRPARAHRARARVPAAIRPGAREHRARPVARRVRHRGDGHSPGCSRSRSRACRRVLAATGYCLGCRLYFLRWWVPDLVTRIWTRGATARRRLSRERRSATAEVSRRPRLRCMTIRTVYSHAVHGHAISTPLRPDQRIDRRPTDGDARIRVGIVGATGYVGAELIRLLSRHPGSDRRPPGP